MDNFWLSLCNVKCNVSERSCLERTSCWSNACQWTIPGPLLLTWIHFDPSMDKLFHSYIYIVLPPLPETVITWPKWINNCSYPVVFCVSDFQRHLVVNCTCYHGDSLAHAAVLAGDDVGDTWQLKCDVISVGIMTNPGFQCFGGSLRGVWSKRAGDQEAVSI